LVDEIFPSGFVIVVKRVGGFLEVITPFSFSWDIVLIGVGVFIIVVILSVWSRFLINVISI
jgi:hypothetical protein